MVSFLVPVYNVEKYLKRALDSMVHQTYSDFEIVCINDGSTDGSGAILEAYADKYPQVKVYTYENAGISTTRNRSLAHARGEYVMFVDSDDFLEENTLEVMMEQMEKNQADLVMCGFVMDYPFFKFYRKVARHKVWDNLSALQALSTNKGINNYPWGKLYKKSLFDGISFPSHEKGFEDTYTIFKAIAAAKKIVTIPNRFYHYVQRGGSLTNNMSLETVMHMRQAYHYQQQSLEAMFPNTPFDFDLQYYNTDMVIIYTLLLFCKKSSHPQYQRDDFSFASLPAVFKPAYYAWLSLACMKFGWSLQKAGKAPYES